MIQTIQWNDSWEISTPTSDHQETNQGWGVQEVGRRAGVCQESAIQEKPRGLFWTGSFTDNREAAAGWQQGPQGPGELGWKNVWSYDNSNQLSMMLFTRWTDIIHPAAAVLQHVQQGQHHIPFWYLRLAYAELLGILDLKSIQLYCQDTQKTQEPHHPSE